MTQRLVLWDIDGTLVRTGEVGAEVFDLAIERVLGTRPSTRLTFSGKTDRQICEEYLLLEGSTDPNHLPAVLQHLEHETALVVDRIIAEGFACAGVETVLQELAAFDFVQQTVLTGNIAANARLKLAAFGLDRYLDLESGTYGDQHSDRLLLLPLAWQRQRELRGVDYLPQETRIIGDTPRDFECARAGGAQCILVSTGRYEFIELDALGADVVLEDLSDTERVVTILTSD